MWQIDISMHFTNCYFRFYEEVYDCGTKYRSAKAKRPMELMRLFYEGISALVLARQTQQPNYRVVGEQVIETFKFWVQNNSRWNFENKLFLLQAELHYLNGEYEKAEASYEASIASARSHRFLNEEAYAYELYGVYLLENRMVDKGHEKLDIAIEKYAEWGALKKVEHVKKFKEVMNPKFLSEYM